MKVLVTGASGLIGRWCCDLLHREGHDVVGTDIQPKPDETGDWAFRTCDLLDGAAVQALFSDVAPTHLLHLAARTDLDGNSVADYAVNTLGVTHVLDAVATTPSVIRAVYTSSQLVCRVGHIPTRDDEYLPSTPYGESKVETEIRVRAADGGGVSWCLARPTTVWGPHMSAHYRSLLQRIETGRFFHSGAGPLYKSYSFAGNIAYQYKKLLMADGLAINRRVFYLADYEPLALRDYVNHLAEALQARQPITLPLPVARILAWCGDGLGSFGVKFPYNSFRLNNIRTEYIFDLRPTEEVCGPLPFSFDEGVAETIAWHKALSEKEARK